MEIFRPAESHWLAWQVDADSPAKGPIASYTLSLEITVGNIVACINGLSDREKH